MIQQLENIERIRARGDPAFQGIDQTLGGGPGVEVAVESGADRSDFGFCPRFLGANDGEAGVAGAQIGDELVLHGMMIWDDGWLEVVGDRVEVGRAEVFSLPGEAGLARGIAVEELAG